MNLYGAFILILSLLGGGFAQAQQASEEGAFLKTFLIPHEEFDRWKKPLSITADFESYTTSNRPIYREGLYDSNFKFTASRTAQGKTFGLLSKTDGAITYSAGEETFHPKIKEASIGSELLRVGVVNEDWAAFEEEWRLGLFRPRFMDNKLSGGQGGLLGIHYQGENFSMGFLPLFIPELGPRYEEKDGRLVSRNPWFGGLPETLNYDGVEAPIRYDVNVPPLSDLVMKPGVVMRYHTTHRNLHSQVSAAYKPMPQLLLNFPADGRFIIGNDSQYFSVEVQPWVAYHTVLSTDQILAIPALNSKARFSLAHEVPNIPNRPETWVTQEIGPATFISSRFETNLDSFDRVTFFVSQFKVFGGDEPDKGRYATENSFFEVRQAFREAYSIGFETKWLRQKVKSSVSGTYDRFQRGGVFSTRHLWQARKDLQVSATIEILGLTTDEPSYPSGFLSDYRANDRAELGVTYVF